MKNILVTNIEKNILETNQMIYIMKNILETNIEKNILETNQMIYCEKYSSDKY